ncbi:unnamed protein product, partial [Allacma fusca]
TKNGPNITALKSNYLSKPKSKWPSYDVEIKCFEDNYIAAVEKATTYQFTSNFESSSESDSDHEARMKLRKRKIGTKQKSEKATKIQKSRQPTSRFQESGSDNSELENNSQQSALVPLYQFQALQTNIQSTDEVSSRSSIRLMLEDSDVNRLEILGGDLIDESSTLKSGQLTGLNTNAVYHTTQKESVATVSVIPTSNYTCNEEIVIDRSVNMGQDLGSTNINHATPNQIFTSNISGSKSGENFMRTNLKPSSTEMQNLISEFR